MRLRFGLHTVQRYHLGFTDLNTITLTASLSFLPICALADEDVEHFVVIATNNTHLSSPVLPVERLSTIPAPSLQTIADNLPTLTLADNSNASKIYFRGIGSQGNAGLEQTLAIYIDNTYQGRSRSIKSSLIDVESIAAYHGAQLTLQGVNSTAGALSVLTRRPQFDAETFELTLNTGEYGLLGATMISNNLLTESFATRFVAHHTESNGFWTLLDTDGNPQANSTQKQSLLRSSSTWQIQENLSADLKIEWQETQQENPFAWQPGGCDNLYGLGLSTQEALDTYWQNTGSTQANPLTIPATCRPNFIDNSFDEYSPSAPNNSLHYNTLQSVLTLEWQWQDTLLRSISSYYDIEFTLAGNDLTHGVSQRNNQKRLLWLQDDVQFLSQALQADGNFSNHARWSAQLYWHKEEVDFHSSDTDARKRNNPQVTQIIADQSNQHWSATFSTTFDVAEGWQLDTRLQYVHQQKAFSGNSQRLNKQSVKNNFTAFSQQINQDHDANPSQYQHFDAQSQFIVEGQTYTFSDWLPEVALSYQSHTLVDGQALFYTRWTQAAKAGGFNFRLNNITQDDLMFDNETVTNTAIGARLVLLDNALEIKTELFHANYRDLQQNSHQGADGDIASSVIRNASRARSQGLDVSGSYQLNSAWTIDWQSTWLDARFTDYAFADCTRLQAVTAASDVAAYFGGTSVKQGNRRICYQELTGKRLAHAPTLSSRVGVNFTYPVTIFTENLELATHLDWLYSSKFFTSPHADRLRQQPSFHKLNAWVSVSKPQQWQVTFSIQNISDVKTSRQFGQDGNAAVSALLDPPRQWSLQGKLFF